MRVETRVDDPIEDLAAAKDLSRLESPRGEPREQWQRNKLENLRKFKRDSRHGELYAKAEAMRTQFSFISGLYFYDWWESCLVFSVIVLAVALIMHGASRALKTLF